MSEDQKARDEAWRAVMRQIAKAYGISEEGFEELGGMDRGLMKRVRDLSERRAETASIKGVVGPQMDRWGMAAAAMGNSEAVAYREGVWIYHSLSYPVYFASVPSVGVVGASNRWYGGSGISAGSSICRRPGAIQTRQEIRNEIFSTEGRRGRREGRKAPSRPGKRY